MDWYLLNIPATMYQRRINGFCWIIITVMRVIKWEWDNTDSLLKSL